LETPPCPVPLNGTIPEQPGGCGRNLPGTPQPHKLSQPRPCFVDQRAHSGVRGACEVSPPLPPDVGASVPVAWSAQSRWNGKKRQTQAPSRPRIAENLRKRKFGAGFLAPPTSGAKCVRNSPGPFFCLAPEGRKEPNGPPDLLGVPMVGCPKFPPPVIGNPSGLVVRPRRSISRFWKPLSGFPWVDEGFPKPTIYKTGLGALGFGPSPRPGPPDPLP